MGLKLTGDWPVREATPFSGETIQSLLGIALSGIGYSDLQQVYVVTGNIAMEQETAAEYAAFQARQKAYLNAIRQGLVQGTVNGSLYEYY